MRTRIPGTNLAPFASMVGSGSLGIALIMVTGMTPCAILQANQACFSRPGNNNETIAATPNDPANTRIA